MYPQSGDARFDLSKAVIGCAIEVHREMGPGLLESAYEQCLAHELRLKDIPFELQKVMRFEVVDEQEWEKRLNAMLAAD